MDALVKFVKGYAGESPSFHRGYRYHTCYKGGSRRPKLHTQKTESHLSLCKLLASLSQHNCSRSLCLAQRQLLASRFSGFGFVLFLCCTACDLAFTTADGCRLSIFLLLWCCGYFCKLKWHFHFYLLLCEDPCHLDNGQLFVRCIVLRCIKKVKLLGWFTYWIVWCKPLLHEGVSVRKLWWCPSAESIALSWIQVVDFSWDMTDIWLYATALVTFDVWLYYFLEELDKMRRTSRKSGKLKLCVCCLWKK